MSAGCTVVSDVIYLVGGHNLEHYLDTVECYDPRTPKWRLVCCSFASDLAFRTQESLPLRLQNLQPCA